MMSLRSLLGTWLKWRSVAAVMVIAVVALPACSGIIGAGVTAAIVGAAALAYDCEDPVSVTVYDGSTGKTLCDATVRAVQGDSSVDGVPCHHLLLDTGDWTVTAEKPGYRPASSKASVSHDGAGCEPSVHRIDLTLWPASMPNRPASTLSPSPPSPPAPGAGPPGVVAPPATLPVAPPASSTPPAAAPPVAPPPSAPPPAPPATTPSSATTSPPSSTAAFPLAPAPTPASPSATGSQTAPSQPSAAPARPPPPRP